MGNICVNKFKNLITKLKILKFIKYRYTNNVNYHGPESNIFDALNNKEPQLVMFNNRNEIIFQMTKSQYQKINKLR